MTKTYERQFARWASEIRSFKTENEPNDFIHSMLEEEIEDRQQFLKHRTEIAKNLSRNLSIMEFLIHKNIFEEYGLTGEMIKRVEGEI